MIKITHILWSKRAIGVAVIKMVEGDNVISITVKDKNGNLMYPNKFTVSKEKLLNIYRVQIINKKGLQGVFIPLVDIERGIFDA